MQTLEKPPGNGPPPVVDTGEGDEPFEWPKKLFVLYEPEKEKWALVRRRLKGGGTVLSLACFSTASLAVPFAQRMRNKFDFNGFLITELDFDEACAVAQDIKKEQVKALVLVDDLSVPVLYYL